MIPPIEIDFVARGITELGRVFDTLDKRIDRFEQRSTRTAMRGARDRTRITDSEEQERERAFKKLEREIEREKDRETKAHEKAEKAKTRETEREEERRNRIRIRSSELAGRAAAKAAQEEVTARRRLASRSGDYAVGLGGRIAGAGTLLAGAVGIGGGFMLADAMRERSAAGRNAGLLVNAVTTGNAPPAGANIQAILGQARQVSHDTGMSASDVTAGALEYARHARGGDWAGIQKNMGFFAKLANVTGADIKEIAAGAGTLQSQNQDLSGDDMQQLLLDVYAQGKAGSMSMTDVAKQMGVLGSTRTSLTGNMAANQRKLLAMGQIAAPGGSIEEAGTFAKDMVLEAGKHAKELRAIGVKFDNRGRFDLDQMISTVFKGTGGDVTKIGHLLGGVRGAEPFREMMARYDKAGGGDKGIAAVMASNREVASATMSATQLEQQNQQLLSDPAKKFEVAATRVKDALMTSAEPALTKFAASLERAEPEIEKLIEKGGQLAEWFAENPIKGIGALILGSVAKDMASAGIGAAVRSVITALIAGAGGGSALGGAAAGTLGRGGLVTAAGVAGGAVAMWDIDQRLDAHDVSQRSVVSGTTQDILAAAGLARSAKAGTVTPEQIASTRKHIGELQTLTAAKQAEIGSNPMGMAQTAMFAAQGRLGEVRDLQTRDQVEQVKQLKQAIEALTKAVNMAESSKRMATAPGDPARHVPIPQRSVN